jgi:hypothetical protein
MHFGTKSYLKNNHNHTAKYSIREEGDKGELNNQDTIICYKYKKPDRVKYMIVQIYKKKASTWDDKDDSATSSDDDDDDDDMEFKELANLCLMANNIIKEEICMMANKNINIDEVNELGPQIKMHLMIIS